MLFALLLKHEHHVAVQPCSLGRTSTDVTPVLLALGQVALLQIGTAHVSVDPVPPLAKARVLATRRVRVSHKDEVRRVFLMPEKSENAAPPMSIASNLGAFEANSRRILHLRGREHVAAFSASAGRKGDNRNGQVCRQVVRKDVGGKVSEIRLHLG